MQAGLRSARLLLALAALLFISSLAGAAATADPRDIPLAVALWFVGQCAGLTALALGLRALRRRRFGATPASRLRRPGDALLYLGAGAGGLLALLAFAPAVARGAAKGLDLAIAAIGAVLLATSLRAAALYVLRP